MRSIIPNDNKNMCHWCGAFFEKTHKHHIFGGANRRWSEKYGLYVHLCPRHHNMSDEGIHFNKDMMDSYHRLGQFYFELNYACDHSCGEEQARAEFMRIFGKNYL